MNNKNIKNLTLSAMFIGIGIILPFFTGQIKSIGNMLLPMHIPVFLCGLVLGGNFGLITGFLLPLIRSAVFGMPLMFPSAISMAFELAAYGFVSGFLYNRLKKKDLFSIYLALITAMLSGRIVWGIVQAILLGASNKAFTFNAFISSAFLNAAPGIVIQLIIIPAIIYSLEQRKK